LTAEPIIGPAAPGSTSWRLGIAWNVSVPSLSTTSLPTASIVLMRSIGRRPGAMDVGDSCSSWIVAPAPPVANAAKPPSAADA